MDKGQTMTPSNSEQRIRTVCLLILSAVAIGTALYWLRPILIPFVLAVFFTYCLAPIIDLQRRYFHFPRALAIVTTVLLGCVALAAVGVLISVSVGQITANAGAYQQRLSEMFDGLVAALPLERWGIESSDQLTSVLDIPSEAIGGVLAGTASGIMNVVSRGVLVLIFMIFLLIGRGGAKQQGGGVLAEIETGVKRYVIAMLLLSAATGLLVGLTLQIIGLEFAWLFGFLTFLLNFIPNIGSIVAVLLPLPVALLSPELSVTAKVLVVVIPGAIQIVIGNGIAPKVMGDALDLHPIVVLLSLIFFGMIWGIVGMFLATPITAVIRILLAKIEMTRPLAGLLAGHPAGLPPEVGQT